MRLHVEELESRDTPSAFNDDFSAAYAAGRAAIQNHAEMRALVAPIQADMARMRATFAPQLVPPQFSGADLAAVLIAIEHDKHGN